MNNDSLDKLKKTNRQNMSITLTFILVLLYMIPLFIIIIGYFSSDGFQEGNKYISWFSAFLESADSTLNSFHKILLPLVASLSIIAFRKGTTITINVLIIFILLSFALSTYASVFLDMDIAENLKALKNPVDLQLAKAFFIRIQETLLMYLMILIGIEITNNSEESQ